MLINKPVYQPLNSLVFVLDVTVNMNCIIIYILCAVLLLSLKGSTNEIIVLVRNLRLSFGIYKHHCDSIIVFWIYNYN